MDPFHQQFMPWPYLASRPHGYHRTLYDKSTKLFDEGKLEQCIKAAKLHLSDPTAPWYYTVKNCLLIACAWGNWEEGELWLRAALQAYYTYRENCRILNDQASQPILASLEREIDEVKMFRMEDLTGLTRSEIDGTAKGMNNTFDEGEVEEAPSEVESEDLDNSDIEVEEMASTVYSEVVEENDLDDWEVITLSDIKDEAPEVSKRAMFNMAIRSVTTPKPTVGISKSPTSNIALNIKGYSTPARTKRPFLRKSIKLHKGGALHARQFFRSIGRHRTSY